MRNSKNRETLYFVHARAHTRTHARARKRQWIGKIETETTAERASGESFNTMEMRTKKEYWSTTTTHQIDTLSAMIKMTLMKKLESQSRILSTAWQYRQTSLRQPSYSSPVNAPDSWRRNEDAPTWEDEDDDIAIGGDSCCSRGRCALPFPSSLLPSPSPPPPKRRSKLSVQRSTISILRSNVSIQRFKFQASRSVHLWTRRSSFIVLAVQRARETQSLPHLVVALVADVRHDRPDTPPSLLRRRRGQPSRKGINSAWQPRERVRRRMRRAVAFFASPRVFLSCSFSQPTSRSSRGWRGTRGSQRIV